MQAIELSLKELGVKYLDLCLIHVAWVKGGAGRPTIAKEQPFSLMVLVCVVPFNLFTICATFCGECCQ